MKKQFYAIVAGVLTVSLTLPITSAAAEPQTNAGEPIVISEVVEAPADDTSKDKTEADGEDRGNEESKNEGTGTDQKQPEGTNTEEETTESEDGNIQEGDKEDQAESDTEGKELEGTDNKDKELTDKGKKESLEKENVTEEETINISPNEGFSDYGEIILLEESLVESNGDEVMAQAAGHGTIAADPQLYNKTYSNKTKISLGFDMRSFGNEIDEYRITIMKGNKVSPDTVVARKIGNFSKTVGTTRLIFEWDTTNVGKYTEGPYTILAQALYSEGSKVLVSSEEIFRVNIVDYRTVATKAFVSRLYTEVLGRTPDAGGLNDWTNRLVNKQVTGAQAVQGFIESTEFVSKGKSNSEYVDILYRTLFNRKSDSGKDMWVKALDTMMTRTYVLKGFADSIEFDQLCAGYGINRGTITTKENRDRNMGATGLVYRFYAFTLGRVPDVKGLNEWTGLLVDRKKTPEEVGYGFVFSREVALRNLSDSDFIKMLYLVFMDRQFDEAGLQTWLDQLKSGKTRQDIFYGFSRSTEFSNLVASYKIF